MHLARLFRHFAGLTVERVALDDDALVFTVHRAAPTAMCPTCHRRSRRVHSSYERHLRDEPIGGHPVTIRWRVRRFRCTHQRCARQTFVEQAPQLAAPYAQQAAPLRATWQAVGLALGGRPGQRLCAHLHRSCSRMTLLRLVQALPLPPVATPTVLGVDEWALRTGQVYGTILIDQRRRRAVELLPDCHAETLADWLRAHPGVEVVTRDRAGAYAEGIRQGAPAATQVADGFHVVKNLRDAVERFFSRRHAAVHAAAEEVAATPQPTPVPVPVAPRPTRTERQQQERRARRMGRYAAVQRLQAEGLSLREMGRQLHLARRTVTRFAGAETFPERQPARPRPTLITPFEPYLRQRWADGTHTATILYQEVRQRGFAGSYSAFAGQLKQWRETTGATRTTLPPRPKPVSVRQAAWWVLRRDDELTVEEQAQLAVVQRPIPELRPVRGLVHRFRQMLHDRAAEHLTPWLTAADHSDVPEVRGFARSLRQDEAAVRAMLRLPWSNGATEGHINRLKMLKRTMFGRAGLPLLKRRFLLAP